MLQDHNQESITQLHDLTANLGLLQMPLPKSLPACDKEFVKHLILMHAMKTTLWSRLQWLQDEINPIQESTARASVGRSLGALLTPVHH
jgi:hypothetical protein